MHSGANLTFASRPKDGAAWSDLYLSTCLTWVALPGALHPPQAYIYISRTSKGKKQGETRQRTERERTETGVVKRDSEDLPRPDHYGGMHKGLAHYMGGHQCIPNLAVQT